MQENSSYEKRDANSKILQNVTSFSSEENKAHVGTVAQIS